MLHSVLSEILQISAQIPKNLYLVFVEHRRWGKAETGKKTLQFYHLYSESWLLKIKCQKFNNFFVIYILLCHPFLEAIKHFLFLPEWRGRVMDNKVLEQKIHWLIYKWRSFFFLQRYKENKEVSNKAGKEAQEL